MSRHAMRRSSFVGMLLVALLATGCGGSDGKTPTQGKDSTAGGAVRAGGTLTIGGTLGVEQLDPNTINAYPQQQLLTLLWNGLTKWAPGMKVEPDLATSWKSSPDKKSWTFTLRDGVTFHDGRPFTATDAVKNLERVLDPKVPAQVRAKIDMIDHVEAVDPTTLKIDLKSPNAELPSALIEVKMTDVDHVKQINKTANGTGPYKLERFVPGQSVDLVRNADYFGEKGHFDRIKITRAADETAAEASFRGGDLNVLLNMPPNNVGALAGGDAQILQSGQPAGAAVWELDTTSPPFDDPRARLALAYAADRETMFQAAYSGIGVVNDADAIISPKSPYRADGLQPHRFDLDKAKQLFAQAGVGKGDTLTFWSVAGAYPEWSTMGEILQQDLAKIGVKLEIRKSELTKWSQRFYPAPKKFGGMVVANYVSFPPLPVPYSLQWFSNHGTCECNWKAPDAYDHALEMAVSSDDESTRKDAYAEMQRILNEQTPIIVLSNTAPVSVADATVRGAWVQSDGGVHLEQAGFGAS